MTYHSVSERVRQRNVLNVGVSLGFKGLSVRDPIHNRWEGFDIDLARAVAAAVLGDSRKINFIPLQTSDRFTALRDGVIDLGTFNASITFQREADYGITFVHPMLFDGEVLMTPVTNLSEPVCEARMTRKRRVAALRGSTTQENLRNYFDRLGLDCDIMLFDSPLQARQAYQNGLCDLYCLDYYLLAGERAQLPNKEMHIILHDRISLEAMSPAVCSHDPAWISAVGWVMKSLIEAESLNICSKVVDEVYREADGYTKTFLQPGEGLCRRLGLLPEFTREVISQVGNYGEIFNRNLGDKSALKLERRDNYPWASGGMLYSPLFI
ncbi:transporter substrate-binding domain-containing protein [Enterobacillus tribolii]|uniref:Amino acid ABC transporter substrate-binding protein (PAAT family) n=1 Tax=Enterobacillus tribolii TaxID=1487935 RepID=A0A370QNV0_9GAMM|nr:transporter substrate-binding domain-containing protein [Enterobacillus tribolii]MBW7981942.1 transporter substrate-binding domain-containing protein [Enterobacillus tribolii]RDK90039.1 amino acid ABC transporter substrate-binding protein (PAAT family) [Enterobacillus tribolii]